MPADNARTELSPLASVCGLYCGACSLYIGTREDPERLVRVAGMLDQSVEDSRCEGCRSSVLSKHCRNCALASCAQTRGHAFCGECAEFPCERFEAFRTAMPHRSEILQDMKTILENGAEAWMGTVAGRYACPACGAINGAYDLVCRRCQHDPGSAFVADHAEEIQRHLLKSKR